MSPFTRSLSRLKLTSPSESLYDLPTAAPGPPILLPTPNGDAVGGDAVQGDSDDRDGAADPRTDDVEGLDGSAGRDKRRLKDMLRSTEHASFDDVLGRFGRRVEVGGLYEACGEWEVDAMGDFFRAT